MKKSACYFTKILAWFLLLAGLMTTSAMAQDSTLPLARVTPDELKCVTSPSGLLVGRIAGDPSKPGVYTLQVKFPAAEEATPHFYPDERVMVVVSGIV